MIDWNLEYKKKVKTAGEAVTYIHSGERVIVAHALGAPLDILDAMVKNKENYQNVEICHMLVFGGTPYVGEGMEPHFRNNVLFVSGSNREAVYNGSADFTPVHFSEVPQQLERNMKPDVVLCQVSPPDHNGYVTLGLNSDYTMPAVRLAKTVIAEVNEKCPRVFGDTFLHISEIDCFVETNRDIVHLPQTELTDIEKSIGSYCAELIKDGDTLQLGIGAIPDAVLFSLKDKKDLGIHSEIVADGVQHLIELGVITGKKKTLHKGKVVATSLFGTSKFHQYVNDNPMFELYPVNYTNDVRIISQHDNLISINSCVQVDLTGQICSEMVGDKQISGIGGQADFVRGANLSKGGKSIIACYATARGGTVSKIVPKLDEGACVTTMRCDVDYVVTEYGIAQLKGQTLANRARSLIKIAHPDFRAELKESFENKYKIKL